MIEGRLSYNSQNERYGLQVSDMWEYEGFHCGECLEVMENGKWTETRMEKAWHGGSGNWYLVGTKYCGDLEYVRARIEDK